MRGAASLPTRVSDWMEIEPQYDVMRIDLRTVLIIFRNISKIGISETQTEMRDNDLLYLFMNKIHSTPNLFLNQKHVMIKYRSLKFILTFWIKYM